MVEEFSPKYVQDVVSRDFIIHNSLSEALLVYTLPSTNLALTFESAYKVSWKGFSYKPVSA